MRTMVSIGRLATLPALAALMMAGAAGAQQQFATGAPSPMGLAMGGGAAANYLVGPGDLLAINVYRSPDLQTQVRVSGDGTILFPSIGQVKVADMTASQIADQIGKLLKDGGILVSPSVNVLVSEVRSKTVSVMGSVARPGQVPLDRPNMTLTEVLSLAGATFGTGSGIVTVMMGPDASAREQFRIAELVSGAKDRAARPGETLVVQAAPTVYVSGEVGRPGAFPVEANMTVGQAVALGGGVTPRGSRNRIEIQRKNADGTTTIIKAKQDTAVLPDDLIVVKQRLF
ncbi:polysaccharide biosynthesis/export family protein [Sphingomonas sp. 1P06PA]|uniref:polysaccharide biosynthesis/export family protein n=1 Tax=Sphingomonas sp. 1P06PA TaxID=554121 RepID=UPI0039A600B8